MDKYSDGLRHLILKILEKDIYWLSKQNYIPGFTSEDLQQELRLTVWQYGIKYNPYKASINTWGKILLKGKLKKLHRDHCTTLKRKANALSIPISELEGNRLYGSDEEIQNTIEDSRLS